MCHEHDSPGWPDQRRPSPGPRRNRPFLKVNPGTSGAHALSWPAWHRACMTWAPGGNRDWRLLRLCQECRLAMTRPGTAPKDVIARERSGQTRSNPRADQVEFSREQEKGTCRTEILKFYRSSPSSCWSWPGPPSLSDHAAGPRPGPRKPPPIPSCPWADRPGHARAGETLPARLRGCS